MERAQKLTTFTLWGSGVMDLRYADFTSTEVEIHACSIMGGQKILLPPEVNVEIHGHGVMGGFDHIGRRHAGCAAVRIRGFSLWGGVGIKRKKRSPQTEVERDLVQSHRPIWRWPLPNPGEAAAAQG